MNDVDLIDQYMTIPFVFTGCFCMVLLIKRPSEINVYLKGDCNHSCNLNNSHNYYAYSYVCIRSSAIQS